MNNSTVMNFWDTLEFCADIHENSRHIEIYTEEQQLEIARILGKI